MYRIIKLLGKPWNITWDRNPVYCQKLVYRCWLSYHPDSGWIVEHITSENAIHSSVSFDNNQEVLMNDISVDIQSATHRIVGDCASHIRIFSFIPKRDDDRPGPGEFKQVSLVQSLRVEAADIYDVPDLFEMDLKITSLSTDRWKETVRWDTQNLENKTDYKPFLLSRFDFAKGLTK